MSANTCAGIANGRLGSLNVPDKSEVIVEPLGSVTIRGKWLCAIVRKAASDSRSSMFVEPVSRQAFPEKEKFLLAKAVLVTTG